MCLSLQVRPVHPPWICVSPGESGHRVQYVVALCGVILVDADLSYYDNAFVIRTYTLCGGSNRFHTSLLFAFIVLASIVAIYFPISSPDLRLNPILSLHPPNRPRRSGGDISCQLT